MKNLELNAEFETFIKQMGLGKHIELINDIDKMNKIPRAKYTKRNEAIMDIKFKYFSSKHKSECYATQLLCYLLLHYRK